MYLFFKRLIDIVGSSIALILLFPVILIVLVIVYLQDFHNPIFSHKRVGRNGVLFTLYKFRSMPLNTPNLESHMQEKLKVTPFGKFLRRSNLDEIPQLFNILKGDMSLIGPRPPISSQIDLIKLRNENGSIKLRPGLTGWAQVNSFDNMPYHVKAELDGYYYKNVSFLLDTKIILMTLAYLTKTPPTY